MSALLEAVSTLAAQRRIARRAWSEVDVAYREAVRRARAEHSLSELARAAGITRSGVQHLLRNTRGDTEK